MYGQEFGALLPNQQKNPLDTYMDVRNQQRQEQQLKMQQDHYNNSLLTDLANRLDFKDMATGTVYDPIFQQNLNAGLKGVAETLKKGGNYSDALLQAMKVASEVGTYSNAIKKKRAELDLGVKDYAKSLSIDPDKLRNEALTRYLFNPDHSLKDTSKLVGDSSDYITDILDKNPELVTRGMGDLYDQIEKGKYLPYEGEITKDVGGIKRVRAYKGKIDPLYNELLDEKGNVVSDNTATTFRVKGEPIDIGGQKVQGVTDDVLNHFYQNPGTRAAVRAEARRLMPSLPQGTKQSDVEKAILHKELSSSANSYINKVKDTYDNSDWQKQQDRLALKEVGFGNAKALKELGASLKEKKGDLTINDVYGVIKKETDDIRPGYRGLAVSVLPTEAQKLILDEARKLTGINQLGNRHIYLKKEDGTDNVGIYWADAVPLAEGGTTSKNQHIGTLTPTGINLKAQPDTKRKGAVIEKSKVKPEDLRKKYNY